MRIIGLDIHRAFAEAAAWDEDELKRLGRVDMRRHLLEAFAKKLAKEDRCTRSDRQRSHSRCGDRTARQASCDREPQAARIIAMRRSKRIRSTRKSSPSFTRAGFCGRSGCLMSRRRGFAGR
jgi:hypothetical protein